MLKPAILYEEQLKQKYVSSIMEEKYKYLVHNNYYEFDLNLQTDTWTQIEMVSVDRYDNVIGFLTATIDRNANCISSLSAINFYDVNITFSRDFRNFIEKLFFKYNFRKIKFHVIVGNPAEKMYDKYVEKYNGRVIGISKDDVVLADGEFYDVKFYEIHQTNLKIKKEV